MQEQFWPDALLAILLTLIGLSEQELNIGYLVESEQFLQCFDTVG